MLSSESSYTGSRLCRVDAARASSWSSVASTGTASISVRGAPEFALRAWMRPVLVVPEGKPADALLEEMRALRRQLVVVLDEYGGTAGIVTLEDLLEPLVGQFDEESPHGREPDPPAMARPEPDGSLVLDGLTRLHDVAKITGLPLGASAEDDGIQTLGGLVMARLGRLPVEGAEVSLSGRRLRVEQLDGRRVALVRLLAQEPSTADDVSDA